MKENVEVTKRTLVRHNTATGPVERTYEAKTYDKVLESDYTQLVEKGAVAEGKKAAENGGGGSKARKG
jgi:hypothetical protein